MREYETIYIVDHTLSEEQVNEINAQASAVIEEQGGAVDNVRTSDVRKLAYEIDGHTDGFYVVVNHRSPASVVTALDRFCRLHDSIPRHLTLVLDK